MPWSRPSSNGSWTRRPRRRTDSPSWSRFPRQRFRSRPPTRVRRPARSGSAREADRRRRPLRRRRVLEAERHRHLRAPAGHVRQVPRALGPRAIDRPLRQPDDAGNAVQGSSPGSSGHRPEPARRATDGAPAPAPARADGALPARSCTAARFTRRLGLPRRERYPDYVRSVLERRGIGDRPSVVLGVPDQCRICPDHRRPRARVRRRRRRRRQPHVARARTPRFTTASSRTTRTCWPAATSCSPTASRWPRP